MLPYHLEKIHNVWHQNTQKLFSGSMRENVFDKVLNVNFIRVTI